MTNWDANTFCHHLSFMFLAANQHDLRRRDAKIISAMEATSHNNHQLAVHSKEYLMQTALYYPFTSPNQRGFLKTALFLWDSVDFIVPYREFRPYGRSKEEQAALEIIGRPYVPTPSDRRNAHDELERLCADGISKRFAFELETPEANYDFYPQKLLRQTWQMLADSKLARITTSEDEVSGASTGPLFGYYMMTILAICCARNRKRMVTDEADPYRALATLLADDSPTQLSFDNWHGRLVALALKGPNFADIPLARLIELRINEDALLRELRTTFLNAVDEAAVDITSNSDNTNIILERINSFTADMERDMIELKRALRRSAASVILSREFGFSILAAASALTFEPISGSLATVGGLSKSLMDYQDRRRKILKDHPASWLLATGGPRFPVT